MKRGIFALAIVAQPKAFAMAVEVATKFPAPLVETSSNGASAEVRKARRSKLQVCFATP